MKTIRENPKTNLHMHVHRRLMCFLIALFTLFLSHNAIAQSIPMCNGGTVPAGQTCVTPPPGITQTSCAIPVNRNFDGTCNNGFFPARGSTSGDNGNQLKHLCREVPSAYDSSDPDNALNPRDGSNPRDISNAIFNQTSSMPSANNLSSFVFTWGQFLDHDLSLTPIPATNPEIADVAFSSNEPMPPNGLLGQTTCIHFERSFFDASGATGTGSPGDPREQLNLITAWIDGSNVYGSDQARADWLRTMVDGKLKTSNDPTDVRGLLPFNTTNSEKTGTIDANAPEMDNDSGGTNVTFVAGDVRASEQSGLTSMHTLFVREHNRICDEIVGDPANANLTDEDVYQLARKKVGALIQKITFEDFLPCLGVDLPAYTNYDPTVKSDITNIFATAAYRIGHTMVTDELLMLDNTCNPTGTGTATVGVATLLESFFEPQLVCDNGIEPFLKGLSVQVQEEIDAKIISTLRNNLFGPPNPSNPACMGLDLATLNIQRGRDHGLPDYNTVRAHFGLPTLSGFAGITSDPALQAAFASVYASVNDVDPWVGMLAEDHVAGSEMGITLKTIMEMQFSRLRDGDYYYYEHDPALSAADVMEIKSTTLSQIIMRNTNLTSLQSNVFKAPAQQCYCVPNYPGTDCNSPNRSIFIKNVSFEDINNTNTDDSATNNGYGDFTNQTTDLIIDESYVLNVTLASCTDIDGELAVWIDFNQDGVFDFGENIFNINAPNSTATITPTCSSPNVMIFPNNFVWFNSSCEINISIPFTVPISALQGPTRIRLVSTNSHYPNPSGSYPSQLPVTYSSFDPCATNYLVGETEDYTVNISTAQASADVTICNGSSTTLDVEGGTAYFWTPSAGLSNPNIANPVASPTSTTFYTVVVAYSDGSTSVDGVEVTVGPETPPISGLNVVMSNSTHSYSILGGGNPNSTYQWFFDGTTTGATFAGGTTGTTVNVNWGFAAGILWTEETDINGCIDSVAIVVTTNTGPFPPTSGATSGMRMLGKVTLNGNNPVDPSSVIAAIAPDGITTLGVAMVGVIPPNGGVSNCLDAGDTFFNICIEAAPSTMTGENFTLRLFEGASMTYLDFPNANAPAKFCNWTDASNCIVNNTAGIQTCPDIMVDYADFCTTYDFDGPVSDVIQLKAGWNLISIDVLPAVTDIPTVFSSLQPNNLRAVTGFNTEGNVGATLFDPNLPLVFNDLQNVEPGFGYWVSVNAADVLTVQGNAIATNTLSNPCLPAGTTNPNTFKEDLVAGWNLVSYIPAGCEPVPSYFAKVIDPLCGTTTSGPLEHVTGYDACDIQPWKNFSISNIANGVPFLNSLTHVCNSLGYWVRLNNTATTIPGSAWKTKGGSVATPNPEFMFVYGTSNLKALSQPIQIKTRKGLLCGEMTVVKNGYLMTTAVYGDDPTTPEIDGALPGEQLIFTLNGRRLDVNLTFEADKLAHKIAINTRKAADFVPFTQISPNPATTQVNITYEVNEATDVKVVVYDILGKRNEILENTPKDAGVYTIDWNTSDFPNGTYLVNIYLGNEAPITEKVVIVK